MTYGHKCIDRFIGTRKGHDVIRTVQTKPLRDISCFMWLKSGARTDEVLVMSVEEWTLVGFEFETISTKIRITSKTKRVTPNHMIRR